MLTICLLSCLVDSLKLQLHRGFCYTEEKVIGPTALWDPVLQVGSGDTVIGSP